ncbi:MAG: hypothetical protein ACLQGP_35120 [Isosphaeraceae bacterium]
MNRLAVFVEGYTEVKFVKKLVEEVAGHKDVRIEHREIRGGGRDSGVRRTMGLVEAARPDTGQEYYVLIVDCGGDDQVKTRIIEEHENLTKKGYSRIIGLRDVRPKFAYAQIPRLELNLPKYIKTTLIPVDFILAVMEVEAWFLAEATHFAKIHPAITVAAIKASLGFDPENDDMEQRLEPAADLHNCYAIGGKVYSKGRAEETVHALDFAVIYLDSVAKFKYLKRLVQIIDEFLA